jgi:type IV secretion system protein TrbL
MSAEILNMITGGFVVAMDGAYGTLQAYSVGLLTVLGTMYFLLAIGRVMGSGSSLGDALGTLFWTACKIGVFLFFARFLYDLMWNGAFYTFLNWGMEGGGSGFGLDQFMQPSAVVDAGFKAAAPLYDVIHNFGGWGMLWNSGTIMTLLIAYWIIVLAYGVMALHVIMTLIEIKLSIATGAILIPWGVLTQTSTLGELSLSWITAGLVRVLLTSLLMSIGVPLFEMMTLAVSPRTGGPDPKIYGAVVLAVTALVFMFLVWILPNRAAAIGGRGMALAMGGDVLIGGGMAAWSAAGAGVSYATAGGAAVVRGTSQMIQAMRTQGATP